MVLQGYPQTYKSLEASFFAKNSTTYYKRRSDITVSVTYIVASEDIILCFQLVIVLPIPVRHVLRMEFN